MPESARLILPPVPLAACIFAAIERDTRGQDLSDMDRFNHFPASPLVAVTIILEGELRLVDTGQAYESGSALAKSSLAGPQSKPVTSWSEGAIHVITLGFFPDAWMKLTGVEPSKLADKTGLEVPDEILRLIENGLAAATPDGFWETVWVGLAAKWESVSAFGGSGAWTGKDRISNWSRSIAVRAAMAGSGKSLRAIERWLRRWSGQNQQSLNFYTRLEEVHRLSVQDTEAQPAGIAHDAGFSDQSHMGRTVRRATGFSPKRLNHLIKTEEAFWCYRLLGERF